MINQYVCHTCGGRITTVIRDDGTTPMMITCRATTPTTALTCRGVAQSQFYRADLIPQDPQPIPEWEWYKPSMVELTRASQKVRDHVRKGSLLIRRIDYLTQRKRVKTPVQHLKHLWRKSKIR